jgi:putative nucleotidyltransferase with HDIG domain
MKKNIPGQTSNFTSGILLRVAIFVIAWLALITVAIYDKEMVRSWKTVFEEGEPAAKDFYSPYTFTYVNEAETDLKRKYEQEKVRDVYYRETDHLIAVTTDLEKISVRLGQTLPEGVTLAQYLAETPVTVIDKAQVKGLSEISAPEAFITIIQETLTSYFNVGLLSLTQKIDLFKNGKTVITLYDKENSEDVQVATIMTVNEEFTKIERKAEELYPGNKKLKALFVNIMKGALKPNLIYDEELTQAAKALSYEDAQPVYDRIVKGEIVLRKGQLISANDVIRIQEIEDLRAKREVVLRVIGVAVIVFVALILLYTVLYLFEQKVFRHVKNLVVILVIIFCVMLLSKLIVNMPVVPIPLPITALAPVLVAILFTPRAALIVAVVQALLTATITDFNALFIIIGLGSGIMALYPTIGLRRRTQFFRISIYVAIINFFTSHGYYMLTGSDLYQSFTAAVYGLLNGLLIMPPLLFVGIWLFEHLFDITTDISLLELSDLNHPILRRLVIEAPGTYHHSLVVSNLAENACEAIGANSLLARVGCYYHDIGKIEKAEYFTENQTAKEQNIHDKLTPAMSCMFITNHVKDGVDLGKRYKLKDVIIDFITQHHGKSLVYFFYKKALDEQVEEKTITSPEEPVKQTDFRYPGPKPQTKECAVAMLADSVEAASRALINPTAESINDLVNKVVNDKFIDNQMDECELTFNDLRKIQRAFVRNLMAIYHTRIEYPAINSMRKNTRPV